MGKRPAKPTALGLPLGPETRIALFTGKESFLRQGYTDELRAAVEATGEEVEIIRFDGSETPPADILDECRSFGLMQQYKLVIVDNAEQFVSKEQRAMVERYAEAPADNATLILRAETWRKGKLDKTIEAIGSIRRCDHVNENQARTAAVRRCQEKLGCTLERDAAALLVSRTGPDLGRIATELNKLASTVGPGGTIKSADVAALVGMSREEEAWIIQSTLAAGNAEAAIQKIHDLITISRADPVPIRWSVVELCRKAATAGMMTRDGTPASAAAGSLKLWGEPKNAIIDMLRHPDAAESLADLFLEGVEADYRGKTGQGDPVTGLETLAIRFASLRR